MVLKTEVCRFSGLRIYPGHGIRFIRGDSQQFLFINAKCKRLFHQKKKPSKIAWTAAYRKAHKKDGDKEVTRKKRRTARATVNRSIVGASVEEIQKKRSEKPEVRAASRDAALRELRERIKKTKEAKKEAKRTETTKTKAAPKSAQPKAPMAKPAKMGKATAR